MFICLIITILAATISENNEHIILHNIEVVDNE